MLSGKVPRDMHALIILEKGKAIDEIICFRNLVEISSMPTDALIFNPLTMLSISEAEVELNTQDSEICCPLCN